MKPTTILAAVLAGLATGQLAATIIAPTYLAADSAPDSFNVGTPDKLIDNSGMQVPVVSGTSLADALAATHIFDGGFAQSYVTNDPTPGGGDYFADAASNPTIVFDLGGEFEVSDLLFWQYQNNGGNGTSIGNWAKDIEVRFNTDAEGSSTFAGPAENVFLLDFTGLGGVNSGQQTTLATAATARYVELTFIDNYYNEPGITGGGDRVGIGEFRVNVLADPEIVVPAVIDAGGNGAPRQLTFPITNNGATQSLSITAINPVGVDGPLFTVVNGLPLTIGPGGSEDILLDFTPGGFTGEIMASLEVESNDFFASPNTIPITGDIREPWIDTVPDIDRGTISVSPGTDTFTIDVGNLGAIETLVANYAGFVNVGGPFSVVDDLGADNLTVVPGGTGVINLAFDSGGVAGVFTDTLEIDSNDPIVPTHTVTVTIEVERDPEISAPALVIGPTLPLGASPESFTVQVENLGPTGDLILSAAELFVDDAAFFTVDSYETNPIAVGSTGDIVITFNPMGATGLFSTVLEIASNDPGVPVTTDVQLVAIADPHAPPPALPGGLVAWWSMDNDLDPGKDDTGNGFDGSPLGTPTSTNGANANTGNALAFSGTTHIDVPWSSYLNPESFTVTLWANPTNSTGSYASPITSRDDSGGGTPTYGYVLYNDVNGNWTFWTGDGDPGWHSTTNGGSVAINTWTHLAISYDAVTETKSIYVDGVLIDSATVPPTLYVPNGPQAEDLHLAAGQDAGDGFYFQGALDDVAVFNTALSETDINTVMNDGVAGFANIGDTSEMVIVINGYDAGNLSVTVNNIPSGQTYHLEKSTDLLNFEILSPAFDFDSTTTWPQLIPTMSPKMFLQAYDGPSIP